MNKAEHFQVGNCPWIINEKTITVKQPLNSWEIIKCSIICVSSATQTCRKMIEYNENFYRIERKIGKCKRQLIKQTILSYSIADSSSFFLPDTFPKYTNKIRMEWNRQTAAPLFLRRQKDSSSTFQGNPIAPRLSSYISESI